MLMRKCAFALLVWGLAFIVGGAGPAFAQTDADVMAAYREYNAAMKAGDAAEALAAAKRAYELAEKVWGPQRKETALLATNYADQLRTAEETADAEKVYNRCTEILAAFGEEARYDRGYCEYRDAGALQALDKKTAALKQYERSIKTLAPLVDTGDTGAQRISGEAYLAVARLSLPQRLTAYSSGAFGASRFSTDDLRRKNQRKYRQTREAAITARKLLSASYGPDSVYVGLSALYEGYYHEAGDEWKEALDLYEIAVGVLETQYGPSHEYTLKAKGRFYFSRMMWFQETGNKEEEVIPRTTVARDGRTLSSDKCMFHRQRETDIEVCVIERKQPRFPDDAFYRIANGGFVMLVYDVNEAGKVENAQIAESWPGDVFDRPVLKAVEKWRYAPPRGPDGEAVRATSLWTIFQFVASD